MSQSNFISQIQTEEKKAEDTLKKLETENNKKIIQSTESSVGIVKEAEEKARVKSKEKLLKTREEAKDEYKRILVDADNERRDVIEGGKVKISKGQKHIKDAFSAMFS